MVKIVKAFDFSRQQKKKNSKINKQNKKKKLLFTVKLSRSLLVGKLGLTLKTWDGKTSGIVPDDAVAIIKK